ncbi:MAG: DUF4340 domain-containing protein [Kiritimatiellae bacterium]|nr:DUF4340 domain-containing protein [Kiritimatiellia bacterium]
MSNMRAIFWLLAGTLAAVAANVLLSMRAPSARSMQRHSLVDPAFTASKVTISRAGEQPIVLERTDRWALVEPFAGKVDQQVVLRLLDALSFTAVEDALSDLELLRLGRTRDDFALAEPALSVAVEDGEKSLSVSFGSATPSSNGVYAAVSGSDVVLVVPSSVRAAADLRAEAFRERDIFPYEPDFVTGFDLKRADSTLLVFTRDGDGWRVGDNTASASKVKEFLALVVDASAMDFVWPVGASNETSMASAALLSSYGLDPESAMSVNLHCRDGADRRILLGNDAGDGKYYALVHNGGAVVTLQTGLRAAALQDARAFSDSRLFPVEEPAVLSFTIADGDTSYVVARAGEGAWRLDSPVAATADAEFASALLGRILALTPSDLSADGLKVSVSTNRAPISVSAQRLLGGRRLEDLRSREILRIDPALVRRLVSIPGGKSPKKPVSVVYSRERRVWSAETDEGRDLVVREAGVKGVLSALNPLKASHVVSLKASASDLARYGIEKPFHQIAVDQEKESSVRRNILIGAAVEGGHYATIGSAEAIFVLPKKVVSLLVAPLVEE